MGASRDTDAPTSLATEKSAEINCGPKLIALQLERSELVS